MVWLLLFSITFGGVQSPSLNDYFERSIAVNINDEHNKKHVLKVVASYKYNAEVLEDAQRQAVNLLAYEFEHRATPTEELVLTYHKCLDNEVQLNRKTINCRLKIQHNINDEEWKVILSDLSEQGRLHENHLDWTHEKLEESFDVLRTNLNDHIADEAKRSVVLDAFTEHEKQVMGAIDSIQSLRDYRNVVVNNIKSTRKDLERLQDGRYKIQTHLFDTYIVFHKVFVENTTEEEWTSLLKEVKPMIY